MALQHRRITLLVKTVYNTVLVFVPTPRRMIARTYVPAEDPRQGFARTGASGRHEPRFKTLAVADHLFLCSFLRQREELGRQRHGRTALASRYVGPRVPAKGGPRGPNYPIRPLWSAGNKNKHQQTIQHLSPPFPVPHPHQHHHLPCQPTTTNPLQVLDHPHSKLGVGGQAPTPPARSCSWLA